MSIWKLLLFVLWPVVSVLVVCYVLFIMILSWPNILSNDPNKKLIGAGPFAFDPTLTIHNFIKRRPSSRI